MFIVVRWFYSEYCTIILGDCETKPTVVLRVNWFVLKLSKGANNFLLEETCIEWEVFCIISDMYLLSLVLSNTGDISMEKLG